SKLYIQGTTLRGPRVSDEDPVTQAQASEGPNVRHVFRVVAAAAGANGAESWICSGSGAPRRFSAWASFGRGGGGGGVPSSRQATLAPPPPKRPELPSEQQVAGAHTHSLTHSRIRPSATRSSQPVGSRQPPRRFRRTPQNTRTHSNSLTKDTHPCKSDYRGTFAQYSCYQSTPFLEQAITRCHRKHVLPASLVCDHDHLIACSCAGKSAGRIAHQNPVRPLVVTNRITSCASRPPRPSSPEVSSKCGGDPCCPSSTKRPVLVPAPAAPHRW
ncbi:unnamed protein product, partial [Acanthoscelides obtectus]